MRTKSNNLEYRPYEVDIVRSLKRNNFILLGLMIVLSLALMPLEFSWSVAIGGAIVLINFQLLSRTVSRVLTPGYSRPTRTVLLRYYLRLTLTAAVIFCLVMFRLVDPIGLLVGLSVVVLNVFLLVFTQIRKLIGKEAI